VRTAALKALGKSGADEAGKVLCEAIAGADLPLAIDPIRQSRNPVVTDFLLEAAEKHFDTLVAGTESDAKKLGQQNQRLCLLLECLRERHDKRTEKLLLRMFANMGQLAAIKGEPSGKDVSERLVSVMATGAPEVRSSLVDAHETLPAESLGLAFIAACRCRKPAEVFALFSPYLTASINEKKKNRDPAFAKREAIIGLLMQGQRNWYQEPDDSSLVDNLDPQWLDLAVRLGRSELVQALARPGHVGSNVLLSKLFRERIGKTGQEYELLGILNTMIRIGYPEATDSTIELIEKCAKAKAASSYYSYYWIGHLIPRLPKAEALPKLEALLPTLPERMIDQLLDYLTQLKQTTPTATSP
jgi:hypothetical protein